MKKHLLYLIGGLLLWSCLDPIDFNVEFPENLIVVDGTFTNSEEPEEVRLSYAIDYGGQIFEPIEKARLSIHEENGASEALLEIEPGIYQFQKKKVQGAVGKSYHLEIALEDGRIYESAPELLRAAPPIDGFSYDISAVESVNDFGKVVSDFNFNLFVESTVNAEAESQFLRWEMVHVYAFEEPYLWYNSFPPDTCKICYVTQALDPQIIRLFDGSNFATAASIKEQVATKTMDFTFNFAQSYRVAQYRISKAAFNYWSNINQISNQVGNIFDAPPAPVLGNVRNLDDPSEEVLGYFSVAGVEKSAIFITKGDIFDRYQPPLFCGTEPRWPTDELAPFCYECRLIEGSAKERPFYWK
ncbi:MAG: DUF4249 domain-containing protein [Bacteroidota bacterium]